MTAAELLRQKLQAAQKRCERFMAIRRDLPATAKHSRQVTARSRWFHACEDRDRLLTELEIEAASEVFANGVAVMRELGEVADGA